MVEQLGFCIFSFCYVNAIEYTWILTDKWIHPRWYLFKPAKFFRMTYHRKPPGDYFWVAYFSHHNFNNSPAHSVFPNCLNFAVARQVLNPFMRNVEKWPNLCMNNSQWPIFNIMHERSKRMIKLIKKRNTKIWQFLTNT